jgi:transcription elongation factor/antiterminator RfaH
MEFRSLMPGERWYAVRTQPARELRACVQLENQNFKAFLPRGMKTIRHARKFTTVQAPFFPQYLFVVLDLTRDRWRSVNGTMGVTGLIMQGDLPHPVPNGIVETMVEMTDTRGLLQFGQKLRVGDRVRVTAGPFADKLATCARLSDSDRVRVLLDIMGGSVTVDIDREYLRAAEG